MDNPVPLLVEAVRDLPRCKWEIMRNSWFSNDLYSIKLGLFPHSWRTRASAFRVFCTEDWRLVFTHDIFTLPGGLSHYGPSLHIALVLRIGPIWIDVLWCYEGGGERGHRENGLRPDENPL